MKNSLRVLILEDRLSDAELIVHELRREGYEPDWKRVDTEEDFRNALDRELDLILADYSLPQFDALGALHVLQDSGLDLPFLIITGSVSEEIAVECMKQGAADYLLKDRLARLGPAVNHALQQKRLEREKHVAEDALKESEALNRAVLNSLNAHIAVLDRGGTIIAVNEAWERFARENGDNVENNTSGVGQNYLDVCRRAAEEGAEDARGVLEGIQDILSGAQSLFTCEYAAHSASQQRWFSLYVTPLQAGQGGAVVTHLEVTTLKQAERQLRLQSAALEAAPNAMMITDRSGMIVWVNPAFTQLTGYSSHEAVGHNSRLVNSGAHESSYFRNMWNTILAGDVWKNEIRNRRKNGSVYTGEIMIAPVRDEQGEISHFVDIETDITERKQHERELEAIVVVANALRIARTRAEMIPVIMDQLMDLLKAQGSSLSLYDPANDEMVIALARGPFSPPSGSRIPAGEGLNGVVISTRQIYLSSNAVNDSPLSHPPFNRPYAVAGVPLISQGQLIGVIWLGRTSEFNPTEVRLLTAIGDMAANAIYRASLFEETELRLQRLTALREIDKAITASLDLNVTLHVLVDQVISQLNMDAADVLRFTPETQTLDYSVGSGFRNLYHRSPRLLSVSYAQKAVFARRTLALSNLAEEAPEFLERIRGRGEDFMAYFAVPLLAKGQVKGVLEIFKRAPWQPNAEWLNFLEMISGQAAIAMDNAELFDNLTQSNIRLAQAYDDTIEGWSKALDLRDRETENHTQRVTDITLQLARMAGMRDAEMVHIRRGALLHDIGKMGIPDAILLKPGPLTPDEWEIIRKHPVYAYDLLSPIAFLRPALDIPYCHHERWDGSGYPRGLKGEQIPLAARIFALADVYEALVSIRCYHEAWDNEQALAYIKEQAGKHFDPKLTKLFLEGAW